MDLSVSAMTIHSPIQSNQQHKTDSRTRVLAEQWSRDNHETICYERSMVHKGAYNLLATQLACRCITSCVSSKGSPCAGNETKVSGATEASTHSM
jgi:hypothetical protein